MNFEQTIEIPTFVLVILCGVYLIYFNGYIVLKILLRRLDNKIKILEGQLKAANILISNLINKK